MEKEIKLNVLYDHYKDTFENLQKYQAKRDYITVLIFTIVLILRLIFLFIFKGLRPPAAGPFSSSHAPRFEGPGCGVVNLTWVDYTYFTRL